MPPQDLEQLKLSAAMMRIELDLIKDQVKTLVTQLEFVPVKLVVYGMVGIIIAAALGGFLSKIFIK